MPLLRSICRYLVYAIGYCLLANAAKAVDYQIDGNWRNVEDSEQLFVISRFDFNPGLVDHASLVLERYPPACHNAALLLEFGPSSQFSLDMSGQRYKFNFKIDFNPARSATFVSHSQQRDDGNYLLLQLVAIERGGTLLSEMGSGERMTIRSVDNQLNTSITIPMNQTAAIIRGSIDACVRQSFELDKRAQIGRG
ncbi:hypothetical protein K0504_08215 [Neiella marina]|uniref:Uncharacterized protein n=1 Tax=Neiella holothuriorum TaxID=2870530 RepID=A0ABS7EFM3_9GAMM|nr:hypothetical protein [Neiella holothuriorum]MBW8191015.1 hypothetical protein [Neiella holothuriorum]